MRAIAIRTARPEDVELVVELVHALAEYEKLAHDCRATPGAMREHLFGPRPSAECLVGTLDGALAGFALHFTTFSTFECKPGIWLEDLFVRPDARGAGLGKALLVELARIAVERGCGRLEWNVLDWNASAIGFYESLGARRLDAWKSYRLHGAALETLASARRA